MMDGDDLAGRSGCFLRRDSLARNHDPSSSVAGWANAGAVAAVTGRVHTDSVSGLLPALAPALAPGTITSVLAQATFNDAFGGFCEWPHVFFSGSLL
jgi:hypothetical protein